MHIIWIEPIDQFVLHRVTMVLCIGVSLRVIVDDQGIYVNLDEHIQWLGRAVAFDKSRVLHSILLVVIVKLFDGFVLVIEVIFH